ncbi:contractile injection system tape measure protein [Photorhabdus hindustanensis]|uniref:Uncharacterized protein n=1 Tax=Photorhabdus hindustanensis TaxID=2918802 RepID=A0A2S8PXW5_9GAMM|nr:contractile injection system tape measure protein [Photorhabdus hindustanensis]PQQ23928.1 hypothetical protein C6H66_17395 [Photorhabdus hindustanensis]
MPLEPNLLNRIIITIDANNSQVAKKVLHGSLLNQANISNLFNTFFTQYPINRDIHLETLTLDLGEINFHSFNSLFPARLNTALNKALSQYQINNQEKKISLKQSKSQKTNNNPSLLHDNNLMNIENFIHYLNQKNKALNSVEVIDNHHNIDINIQQLINQLIGIEDKWVLLLAKSCLSEPSLQRLLALKQPALFIAINHKLSERINRSQYLGESVSPGQLILNALQYIQLNNTQEIPKLDAKVISYITTELESGALNPASVITLFRQIIIHNIPLNSWLRQIWQTTAVAKFSAKYLSVEEYQYLEEYITSNHTDKNHIDIELTIAHTNIHNSQEDQYWSEHFIPNHTNKNKPNKQSIINKINNLNVQEEQHLPENLIVNHTNNNKSGKKLSVTDVDIHSYQYPANKKVTSENQKKFSVSNNSSITNNRHNQFRTTRKAHSESALLSEQTLPYQVNNAGILILWPMLSTLFNQLNLLEGQRFIHRQAQFSAINFFNYLIWGNEEIQVEPNILNNILCGLMVNESIELAPVEPEKQLIIDQWLDAIISQLPGWKKLTRNDARQLFLQRPGELLINDQEINITVEHQPFDVLLTDWPWPLNIAKLPWLARLLLIDWQNI